MGAKRDEEPSMLGTPLVARTVSYRRPPCLVGAEERVVTCMAGGLRRVWSANRVRVGLHVWFVE